MYKTYTPLLIIALVCIMICSYAQEEDTMIAVKALERRAQSMREKGDWQGAMKLYDEIMQNSSVDSESYLSAMSAKGEALSNMNDPEKALEMYSSSIDFITTATEQQKIKNVSAHGMQARYDLALKMAELYGKMGKPEEREKALMQAGDFLKSAAEDPDLPPAQKAAFQIQMNECNDKVAEFYTEQGDVNKAISSYENALSNVQGVIAENVIQNLPVEKRTIEVERTFQSMKDISYPLKLAELYEEAGDREKARLLYKQVRRAADRALTDDTYDEALPGYREKLQGVFNEVQTKLIEMETYSY